MSESQYTNADYQTKALERIADAIEKHNGAKLTFNFTICAGIIIGIFFTLVFRAAGVLP